MTKNQKLGLFLLPLVPLTAIGIIEVASRIIVPAPIVAVQPIKPTPVIRTHRYEAPPPPPRPAPVPAPAPAPVA